MSQLTSLLDSIFKTNGGTTSQWRSANEILLTHTDEVKKYCSYMKNKIRDLNKNTQLLALDFLDYSIDDGKIPLWTQVGSKEFLSSLVNIYKTRNDEEVQNKILYLIQKWANKFKKYNTIIPNFNTTYDNLKENEVEFPDNMESTYEKYLQGGSGGNNNTSNSNNNISNKFNNKEINSENKNYVKKINLDLRPSSYERKYKRLVNKLDDWTQQIQDANVFMDMANEDGFDDELRGICSELEGGKGQLVDTIESGKLKDEKLMQISLNVQSDIEMTLKRWNDVKNGRKPENFKSAFFNSNENNNYSNNNFGGNNNNSSGNQNKGGFDLLGFDDDLGGNNNNNGNSNNNNLGNDLFDVFSGNNNNANNNGNNQGNDFFGNMGNNNVNNNRDLFGNNDSNMNQNNQNNFNNNFFGNNNMNNQMNQNQNNNNQGNDLFNNFGNNINNAQNNNQNFFGNNTNNMNQNNQTQNNPNNDLFSQLFNNNNNVNKANINNLQNNLNSVYTETNQFGMDFTKNNNMNINNNNTNSNNNNNFNNIMAFNGSDFSNNNNNFNFNGNNNQNNKNTSNKDFVFNF